MKTIGWPRCSSRHYRNRRSSSASAPVDEYEPGATHCRQRQHILHNGGQAVETAAHVERPFLPPDTRGARKQRPHTRMRSSTPPGNARSMVPVSRREAVGLSACNEIDRQPILSRHLSSMTAGDIEPLSPAQKADVGNALLFAERGC